MKLTNFISRNSKKVSFILSFLIIVGSIAIFTKGFSELTYYWDSNYYYELSQSFVVDGMFDITNYPLSIRGYFWPFALFLIKNAFGWLFTNDKVSILLLLSLLYTYVFSVCMPRVMSFIFKKQMPVYFGIIISLLICVFWIGLIVYPLTDMIAFCMIILLIDFLIKISQSKRMGPIVVYSIISGFLAYAIYNARSAAGLFSVSLMILVFILKFHTLKTKSIVMVSTLVGVLVLGIPQMIINQNYGKGSNIALHADNYFGSGESLVLYQLRLGITYQRYDTLVGTAKEKHQNDTFIEYNQAGIDLLHRYQMTKLDSYTQYIKMVIGNPLIFAGIYVHHFETLLDARYGEIYIDTYDERPVKLIANWIVWFIAFSSLVYSCYKLKKSNQLIKTIFSFNSTVVLGIVLGSILAFPGVPEYRFFFPVYMLVYTLFIQFVDEVTLKLLRKN